MKVSIERTDTHTHIEAGPEDASTYFASFRHCTGQHPAGGRRSKSCNGYHEHEIAQKVRKIAQTYRNPTKGTNR